MHSVLVAIRLTLVAVFVTALPLTDTSVAEDGIFSISQVRNPNYERHGPIAYYKALRKFGGPIPDHLMAAVHKIASKRSTGSALAMPEKSDIEYLTPVSIGTPPQQLNLDLDSGSGDLWVFSSELSSKQVHGQTLYTPAKSSTAKKLDGQTWEIVYGDGSYSSGDVYSDVVSIGGLNITNQTVECAQKVSRQFSADINSDGLVGLGFSKINTVKPMIQNTFFDNVMSSLDKPVWTADLKAGAPGKYNFGYIDNAAHDNKIIYTDVDSSDGFWKFTATGYSIGSGALNSTDVTGIADTGTTILLLAEEITTAYYHQVPGAKYKMADGGWVFPCDAELPDFSLEIGDRFTVPGKFINYSVISESGTDCFGGIQPDTGIGFSIFGDVALKAWFVIFDGEKKQLGFANKSIH